MDGRLVTPQDKEFTDVFRENLEWCEELYMGVAYGNYRAFELFEEEFNKFLREDNGVLRALFDIEKAFTDYRVIEEIATIPGNGECKVYIKNQVDKADDIDSEAAYHPKLYLFINNSQNQFRLLVGSSNFTKAGLLENIECNVELKGKFSEEIMINIKRFFDNLWESPYTFNVFDYPEILYKYRDTYRTHEKGRKRNRETDSHKELKKIIETSLESKFDIENLSRNKEMAFLLGLISARAFLREDGNRIYFRIRTNVVDRGKETEGYYLSPTGDYEIKQEVALREDMARIREKLIEISNLLHQEHNVSEVIPDLTEHTIRYHVYMDLPEQSAIKNVLDNLDIKVKNRSRRLSNGDEDITNQIVEFVPEDVLESDNKNLIRSFLEGYTALKSRIRHSDATPSGDLRVGFSFSNKENVDDFMKLFEKIGINDGMTPLKRDDRESMIRIKVDKLPAEIFLSPWRRRMWAEFQEYDYTKEDNLKFDFSEEQS